ncbi:MAG: hypothetical protein COA52_00965 [Hyphomicrobiales bacterium]|nr:MAG: hypothetical protein COA52_00965 [Hyphomicrobiales bacterium]
MKHYLIHFFLFNKIIQVGICAFLVLFSLPFIQKEKETKSEYVITCDEVISQEVIDGKTVVKCKVKND